MDVRTVAVTLIVLTASGANSSSQPPQVRRVVVEAERYAFTPSRIKLVPGEEIDIVLRSADTGHGFKVEGTDIAVEIPKRGKGEIVVRYKASETGRFTYECHRMCGAGHHFMRGEIVVEAKE